MLFTPLRTVERPALQVLMAHQLAHATFDSSRPWIYEGLAHFAQALEREAQAGRGAALDYMGQHLPALVEAEKQTHPATQAQASSSSQSAAEPESAAKQDVGASSASSAAAQSLITATDEVFYRSKAMYCWWMLRDMIGDTALQHALARYRAVDDKEPSYIQRLLEAEGKHSLEWFFDDWVYRDRGLPDFKIESAFPRPTLLGSFNVILTIENLGEAAAEVPVTVRAEGGERGARVQVAGHQKAVARVLFPSAPASAQVNDGSVPETGMKNHTLPIVMEKKP
jgi:hypothetical protein